MIVDLAAIDTKIRAGVHFGEVEIEGDHITGLSVHIGARLMSLGGAGEIVVSSTVRDLMTGSDLPFVDRGFKQLKGVEAEWHVYSVDVEPPAREELELPDVTEHPPWWRRPVNIGLLAAGLIVAVVAGSLVALSSDSSPDTVPRPNTLVRIDGDAVGAVVPVGTGPGSIAGDGSSIWVANTGDKTVQRVDAGDATALPAQGGLFNAPTSIAVGPEAIWVGSSLTTDGSLVRIDPTQANSTATPVQINMPVNALAYGDGTLWIADRDGDRVARLDPTTEQATPFRLRPGDRPAGIAIGEGAVWVALQGAAAVARLDPSSGEVTDRIPISAGAPDTVAVGSGFVWVAVSDGDAVVRIDPASNETFTVSDVGDGPAGIAAVDDAVWVADSKGGEIARIDPATGAVAERVSLGSGLSPQGVVVTSDGVWVSIGAL